MLITFPFFPAIEILLLFELFFYLKIRSKEIKYERINRMQEIDESNLIVYNAILKLKNISSDIEFNKIRKIFSILNISYKEYFEGINFEIIYRNPSMANSSIFSNKINALFDHTFNTYRIYNIYRKIYIKKNLYFFDDFRIGLAEYDDSCFSESDILSRINYFTRCENMDLYFSSINNNIGDSNWDNYYQKKLAQLQAIASDINKSNKNLTDSKDGYIKFKRFFFNKSKGVFNDITDKLVSAGLFRERSHFENLFNYASKLEAYGMEHKQVQWEGYVYQITYMFQLMIYKKLIVKEDEIYKKISDSFLNGNKKISHAGQRKEFDTVILRFLDSDMKPLKNSSKKTYIGLMEIWNIFDKLNL